MHTKWAERAMSHQVDGPRPFVQEPRQQQQRALPPRALRACINKASKSENTHGRLDMVEHVFVSNVGLFSYLAEQDLQHDGQLHRRLLALVRELEPHLERRQLLLEKRARLRARTQPKHKQRREP